MPLLKFEEMSTALQTGQRLVGLDVGTKTVGMALSDATLSVATPTETLKRTKWSKDREVLLARFQEWNVGGVVIGLPVNMDGTEGPRCQATRQFARNLMEAIDLPVCFQDERLSTVAVERLMIEADLSRKRRGELVDKAAAAFILQGALDRLRNTAPPML